MGKNKGGRPKKPKAAQKKARTASFSPRASAILDKTNNASAYLEALVLRDNMIQIKLHRSPLDLLGYLNALGTWRMVLQADPRAAFSWQDGGVITTTLDLTAVGTHILSDWQPLPVLHPWNGSTGFDGKAFEPLEAIAGSNADRLTAYRKSIDVAKRIYKALRIEGKPDPKLDPKSIETRSEKHILIEALRGNMPDLYLEWLDAVVNLTDDGTVYNPVLGTGGNVGRLDIQRRYMESLLLVMDPETGRPTARAEGWLHAALQGATVKGLPRGSMGQYSTDTEAGLHNPWDWLMLCEGAALLGAAAPRRYTALSSYERPSPFPWIVNYSGAGTPHAETEGICEAWLPCWLEHLSYHQAAHVMGEGLALLASGEHAKGGVDFAVVAGGGGSVESGLDGLRRGTRGFLRVGIVPNGQSRNAVTFSEPTLTFPALETDWERALAAHIKGEWERIYRAALAYGLEDGEAREAAFRAVPEIAE